MSIQNKLAMKNEADNLENLIEEISEDLAGTIPHERVAQVVTEIAADYQDATVTSFVPIFIQRYANERLRKEIQRKGAN